MEKLNTVNDRTLVCTFENNRKAYEACLDLKKREGIKYHSLYNLGIKKVIFNYPATIVLWKDNTKTVVKCSPDDEFDTEKGLAMAILKKQFGNDNSYHKIFKKWIPKEPDNLSRRNNVELTPMTKIIEAFSNLLLEGDSDASKAL